MNQQNKPEPDVRNNKKILVRILRKEFLVSGFLAFCITLLICKVNLESILEVFSKTDFPTLIIQSIIGLVVLSITLTSSILLSAKGNEHLARDWEFRTGLTKIVFISFIVVFLVFLIPFSVIIGVYFSVWITLTTMILVVVGYWRLVGSARRMLGYSTQHG